MALAVISRPVKHLAVVVVVVAGCGFSVAPGEGGGAGAGPDAATELPPGPPNPDAPIAPPPPLPLFAASNQMLYELDVDLETTSLIGPIAEPGGPPFDVDGLALHGTRLIGLSAGGGELIAIDPATAQVTSRITLTPAAAYGGLTVVPAGALETGAVVFAGSGDDGKLHRIDPVTGAVTMVGSFGGGLRFFTDLAWIDGAGLYATLQLGVCADVCLAAIDSTTGAASVFRSNLTGVGANLFGLSGYRAQLWALNNAGPVLTVDRTTGVLALAFDPLIAWTEAAQ